MEDLSAELQDEYNQNYQQAFEILNEHVFIQDRRPGNVGFFGKRALKKAIIMLTRCVEIWPGAWSAMWGLGKAMQALGDHVSALSWFERALVYESGNPDIYREATIEALGLGKAEKAVMYARKACDIMPDNAGLQANFALALLLNRQGTEALQTIQMACRSSPDDPVSKNVLAYISDIVAGNQPYPHTI